ncbi:sulfotransferase family protein [Thiohalorhabdus sp. Cl-TMA]|uniref:Sulfotransferase n=1 Tax=Thiohalorhabdus methylotrophus TaxID=3242694 RepID=A0ABV4U0I3_9GAMM
MTRWPNTFIVGAAKSGTTSLHTYLGQHPQAFMSPVKEPHFFSGFSQQLGGYDIDQKQRYREYLGLFEGTEGFPVVGESSPSYLFDPYAPREIHETVPDARIVVLLRNPVERAFSHYMMDVRNGVQNLTFYEALLQDWNTESRGWWTSSLYIDLGLYATQLSRYLNYFEREQIGVFLFSELQANPSKLAKEVVTFLGLSPGPLDELDQSHAYNPYIDPRTEWAWKLLRFRPLHLALRSAIPRKARWWLWNNVLLKPGTKPEPDHRALQFLKNLYAPQIASLESMLGRSLPELRAGW